MKLAIFSLILGKQKYEFTRVRREIGNSDQIEQISACSILEVMTM